MEEIRDCSPSPINHEGRLGAGRRTLRWTLGVGERHSCSTTDLLLTAHGGVHRDEVAWVLGWD
eukprot:scaffold29290_cov31-Tisochrysis_lutea.AAC.3